MICNFAFLFARDIEVYKIKSVLKNFERVKKQVINVSGTGAVVATIIVEFHVKCDLSQLMSCGRIFSNVFLSISSFQGCEKSKK